MEQDFETAISYAPQWVQYWLNWMMVIIIASPILLLFQKQTRKDAIIVFIAMAISIIAVNYLFMEFGYVRLLGLGHIITWTPLAYYLFKRLRHHDINKLGRITIQILLATILISLAFDYIDTIRYILGDRDIMYQS